MCARLTWLVCGIGVALHLYTMAFKAEGGVSPFLVGLLLVSALPYGVAGWLATRPRWRVAALGAAVACLAADLYAHHSVFVAPQGSTAAIGLVVMPVANLLAIGPAGAGLLWLARWLCQLLLRPRAPN